MASSQQSHFADPHKLSKVDYSGRVGHTCNICGLELTGIAGYRCQACDFDVHEVCADHFTETVSLFAHPWHHLKLSRIPPTSSDSATRWCCDMCMEPFPPGSFAYRCVGCMFDVHPLCTMVPQTIRSPLHPEHDLNMVPSAGRCRVCRENLPIWQYVCGGSCLFRVHISCVTGEEPSGAEQGSAGQGNSSSPQPEPQTQQGTTTADQTTSGSQSIVVKRSRTTRVAKFLLKRAFFMAIDATTGGLGSPLIEILAQALG
ncbi:hypothetical protein PR202_ga29219 [Eleusine coracana subsp. coracana]|uniref:Phorbol-ester/DAG-type domain-containing protein n=1 Tax=Eleusine coracana subsp. coracana TaxID=191504 RepID=A0AAV5DKU0_ELECO|nr:hypothetical protein QOZ80_7AG0576720 [Eleusine coracana subsp. coracana]GJN11056.1 hypothetical protein PR202_ga29219 [Eleusine coracana subsp. coracana]